MRLRKSVVGAVLTLLALYVFYACESPLSGGFERILVIQGLNCASRTQSGTLVAGSPASGVSVSIPYIKSSGGLLPAYEVGSSGVGGLTAKLVQGSLGESSGNLVFSITGTPSASGTASFALNVARASCTLQISVGAPVGTITSLNCSSAVNTGSLVSGTAANGVSSQVSYSGGNGSTYSEQSANSTGVTGLTATLAAGTLSNGSGSVTYTITGTPSSSGTASFALSLGGQSCTLTRTVSAPAGSITSLNCSSAVNTGSLVSGTAANGVSSQVSYSGGNGGTYSGQAANSTGVAGLTATLATGTLSNGSGSVTYTITGTPSSSGTASFALSLGGQSCTLTRTVSAPAGTITSLNCSSAVNTGTLVSGTSANGVSSQVSYSGGNGGTYSGQAANSTGVTGLTATLAAGTLSNGSGSVTYTIIGTPSEAGTASFALSLGGQSCTLTRTVTIAMKNIPAGTFSMGCTTGDPNCFSDESPVRSVTLSAFQIGETEVTQAQWQAFMGSNPSYFPSCAQCPIEQVSWYDAVVFCNRLSEANGLTPCYYSDAVFTQVYGKTGGNWSLPNSGTVYRNPNAKGYRLPTEAEWEYAARGGSTTNLYSGSNSVDGVAWYASNSGNTTRTVKGKSPNGYGLYDMSGNVWEWCADWYDAYPSTAQSNPTGPSGASSRVNRGGSWFDNAQYCRVSLRSYSTPSLRGFSLGFRLAL